MTQKCSDCKHYSKGMCKRFKLKMKAGQVRCASGFEAKDNGQQKFA